MNLRRCPGCGNMVARESILCPICGRNYSQVMAGRVIRWLLASAMILWAVYELAARHHA